MKRQIQKLYEHRSPHLLVEDYLPFADSVEWRVGQDFLRASGSRAFVGDASPVPFVVNNDGELSTRHADLLFASLDAGHGSSTPVLVLELGIGVGLFAKFLLDRFRWICELRSKPYYENVTYVLGDYSPKMLQDAARNGALAGHREKCLFRVINALDPLTGLKEDFGDTPAICAIHLNYLLDCLPASFIQIGGGVTRQLCVRTCFRGDESSTVVDHLAIRVAQLLNSNNANDRRELRRLADGFVAEYDFRDCELNDIPLPHSFHASPERTRTIVHSYGAIASLENLVELLTPNGFILMNDYGAKESDDDSTWFEHQRYSGATFVGVNFDELKRHFHSTGYQFVEPTDGNESLHSRLLGGKTLRKEVTKRFQELFSKKSFEESAKHKQAAANAMKQHRYEMALSAYERTIEKQPYDWISLAHMAEVLSFGLRNPTGGLAVIREAIALNPNSASHLWDIAGECLLELGRVADARHAFETAININREDVRARKGMASVLLALRRPDEALHQIASGLARCRDRNWTQQLVAKQNEILVELDRKNLESYRTLANRIRPIGLYRAPESGVNDV